MKKYLFLTLLFSVIVFTSCHTNKTAVTNATTNTMKANLIDGTWEVNYILNTPKPIGELFPNVKPTITFDSYKNAIFGMSGCNNFNGKCTIEANSIKIESAIALTRKMCPNMSGEQAFLETLKKVNSYSVSNQGKTLNLIMGDIAVMRLERK
ncbi:META domain-containing protein [Flavobacterium buctense]|uniref:META domain-containing protein n=1 Tax=Flavobacterium buctense TaxID=1648146 RepID=A0ABU9E463_9FLAO|nr:META domain-containing protein [Flavobacterium buctense]